MYFAAWVVNIIANILLTCLFVRALLSWFVYSGRGGGYGYGYGGPPQIIVSIYNFLGVITEPIVKPVRRILSRFNTGPVDFSTLGAMLLIILVRKILIALLLALA